MEEKEVKKNFKAIICTILIVLFFIPSFAYAKEIRTSPLKSFFARFIKKKESKIQEKKEEINVTTIKGSITLSIDDCVNYAVKHDPNLKIYEDIQKTQKSLVGQAKSNYFPTLYGGTGYYINNTQYSRGMDGSLNNNYYGVTAGINQLIWDFGRTTANINMNKYSYEASGYDLSYQIAYTIYNVKVNYTTVLQALANKDIDELSVRINELNVERTKAMYEVGLKSKIDLVNAQYNLTQAKITLLEAENQYQTALIALNNSMYYVDEPDYLIKNTETFNFQNDSPIKNIIDISYDKKNDNINEVDTEIQDGAILSSKIEKKNIIKNYNFKPYDNSLTDSIKTAFEKRPDIESAKLLVKVQEEALKVVKKSYYPAINASAGYSLASRNDYNSNIFGAYAGIDLPSNVNGMYIKYQIDQGKALLDRAINYSDMVKDDIYFQVQDKYVTVKLLEKKIPLMSDEVQQAFENFKLADGRYAVGLGNYIELQQALTNYNNAQLAFVKTVFDYNKARFDLALAMGII